MVDVLGVVLLGVAPRNSPRTSDRLDSVLLNNQVGDRIVACVASIPRWNLSVREFCAASL